MGCEHGFCRCAEAPFEADGKFYCSEYCATTAGHLPEPAEEGCACGHDECVAPLAD